MSQADDVHQGYIGSGQQAGLSLIAGSVEGVEAAWHGGLSINPIAEIARPTTLFQVQGWSYRRPRKNRAVDCWLRCRVACRAGPVTIAKEIHYGRCRIIIDVRIRPPVARSPYHKLGNLVLGRGDEVVLALGMDALGQSPENPAPKAAVPSLSVPWAFMKSSALACA